MPGSNCPTRQPPTLPGPCAKALVMPGCEQAGDLLKPEPSPAPQIPERMSGPKTGPTLPSMDPLTTTTEGSGAPLTPDTNMQTPQQTDTAQVTRLSSPPPPLPLCLIRGLAYWPVCRPAAQSSCLM